MRALCLKIEEKMSWVTSPGGLEKKAKRAFGEWLSEPSWEWYTTHTFKADYVSPKAADRKWYSWFNSVRIGAKSAGISPSVYGSAAPYYFRVAEYQNRGTLHYHALVGGVGDLKRLQFKDYWEMYGFARVEAYEPGKGANYYVGKYLTKTDGDIRFSHNLTPYLTRGLPSGNLMAGDYEIPNRLP
jgi:hypothetical protein